MSLCRRPVSPHKLVGIAFSSALLLGLFGLAADGRAQPIDPAAAHQIMVSTGHIQVVGERVTCSGKIDVASLQPLGVTLEGPIEAVIQGGRLTSVSFMRSDITLTKLHVCFRLATS